MIRRTAALTVLAVAAAAVLIACGPGPVGNDGGSGGGAGGGKGGGTGGGTAGGTGGGTAGGSGGGTAGGSGGGTGGGTTRTLQSIALTPAAPSLAPGASQAFTATGTYSDATTGDVTASAVWTSSVPSIATVSAAGLATALMPGSTTLTATIGTVTGTTSLTVTGVSLVSIALTPTALNLGVGDTQPYTATGTYSDLTTKNITALVTWASSAPAFATLSTSGLASAVAIGSTNLTASYAGITGTTPLTVTTQTLRSIAVTPAFVSLAPGQTKQLKATGTYSDGSTRDVTTTATWVSSSPANATVSTGGLVSAVAALSSLSVTASIGAFSARSVVSVTNPGFALVSISLAPQTLWVGQKMPYPDVSADFGGVGSNYGFVSWTQTNPLVARLDPLGTIYALAVGVTTLTATTDTATATLTTSNTLTVSEPPLSSIAVLPILPKIAQGAVLQMTATGVYPDANLNKDLTSVAIWSSSNPAVVTVDATGLARGISAGTAILSAKSGAITGSTTATVPSITPPQSTVTLSPVNDNTVMYSSLVPARQATVYPTTAMFSTPAVAVGCAWFYSPAIGPAPEHIDAACSRALVKFDLSALAGKTILSAKLRLETSIYGVGYVPRRWAIHALATGWNGATVTWNNSTALLHYLYSQTIHDPPTYGGQVFELDQTNTVKNWLGNVYANNGYQLILTTMLLPNVNTISLDQFEFFSSEDPGGRGPKLVVTYQ